VFLPPFAATAIIGYALWALTSLVCVVAIIFPAPLFALALVMARCWSLELAVDFLEAYRQAWSATLRFPRHLLVALLRDDLVDRLMCRPLWERWCQCPCLP
jgi:hypothetical protein